VFTPRISQTFLILSALVIGLAAGAAAGVLASRLLRINFRAKDAILGGISVRLGSSQRGVLFS